MHPRIKFMRDVADLSARLRRAPSDAEGPTDADMLAERAQAAELMDKLVEELRGLLRELLKERSALHDVTRAAEQALPLLRFAEAQGTTLDEMRAGMAGQRLATEGDVVLAWLNQGDLLRMQENRQAEGHGDNRRVIEVYDDHPVFGQIITYDEDFNDPPPDLRVEVDEWLKAEQPDTIVTFGKLGMSFVLNFPSSEALEAFRARWGEVPEAVVSLPASGL